jgi:hypothetical protein
MSTSVVSKIGVGHIPFLRRSERQAKTFIVWFCASVLLLPFVLMIHETGHLLVGFGLGFRHLRLHYESVSYAGQEVFWQLMQAGNRAAAAAMTPFWKVAALEIAGPLASIATVLIAAYYVRRYWLVAVIGTVGIFRFIAPAAFLLVNHRLARQGLPPIQHWGMDEFDFWLLTGITVGSVFVVEVGLLVAGLALIASRMAHGIRLSAWLAMFLGMWAGVTLWYRFGPWLLP